MRERIVDLAGKYPASVIAQMLGITKRSVQSYAHRNGISLSMTVPRCTDYWTPAEDKILKSLCGKMTASQISSHIPGRSVRAVKHRVLRLGISLQLRGDNHYLTRYSDHDVELCRQLYDEGLSGMLIAEKMEIPRRTVYKILNHSTRR